MEWLALALICPLSMGLMMLVMMRWMRGDRAAPRVAERPSSGERRGADADVTIGG